MRRHRIKLICLALLLLLAGAAFFRVVIPPSRRAWAYARQLSDALTGARSVTLVEFQRNLLGPDGTELIFRQIPASAAQIASLRAATGAWIAPISSRQMNCFEPHHRVEIVQSDGSELRFEVCFECGNFALGKMQTLSMPFLWRYRLANFFSAAGMPPLTDAEYRVLSEKHPGFQAMKEARDRAIEEMERKFKELEQNEAKPGGS